MLAGDPIKWTDPRSWPWFVWVWLAFLLASPMVRLWRRLRKERISNWSVATGQIESAEVSQPKSFFQTDRNRYLAQLSYSYAVLGSRYSGIYKRDFYTEREAEDFVRDLKGKTVVVHYDESAPSSSGLTEADIKSLLDQRAPVPGPMAMEGRLPAWTRIPLLILAGVSAVGFVISLWVHIGAVMGRSAPTYMWAMHLGVFVIWFPAVFAAREMVGNTQRRDFWNVIFRDSPWMRYIAFVAIAYPALTFFFFHGRSGAEADTWRSFSAGWMAFYATGAGILYSCANAASIESTR